MEIKKNLKWKIGIAVFSLIFVLAVIFILLALKGCNDINNTEEATADIASSYEGATDVSLPKNPIDFDALNRECNEIYAYLRVGGTTIDYPVVQSLSDDAFYLRRDIYGNFSMGGCLFTQSMNSMNFTDPNTVIYGHCMSNGTFFAPLHNFRDPEFFENNKYFYIYTRCHILTYLIFSAYEYDSRHILLSYDFSDKSVFEQYLRDCMNPQTVSRNVRESVSLNSDSRIVTLSTCLKSGIDSKRYLVQGVLIKDEQTL